MKQKNNPPSKPETSANKAEVPDSSSCEPTLTTKEKELRQGRKSLITPGGKDGKNRLRYIEGTTPLKDGCWLSSD